MTPHKAERVSRRNFRIDNETNLKRSFVPFLHGESPENWPDAWYSQTKGNEVYYTQRIVQTNRYKCVCKWFDFDELYDLEPDPHDMVKLAYPGGLPSDSAEASTEASSRDYRLWPPLPAHLDADRQELLAKMWRFARRENDIIFY